MIVSPSSYPGTERQDRSVDLSAVVPACLHCNERTPGGQARVSKWGRIAKEAKNLAQMRDRDAGAKGERRIAWLLAYI